MRSAIANGSGSFNFLIYQCLPDRAFATEGPLVAILEQWGRKREHPPSRRARA